MLFLLLVLPKVLFNTIGKYLRQQCALIWLNVPMLKKRLVVPFLSLSALRFDYIKDDFQVVFFIRPLPSFHCSLLGFQLAAPVPMQGELFSKTAPG